MKNNQGFSPMLNSVTVNRIMEPARKLLKYQAALISSNSIQNQGSFLLSPSGIYARQAIWSFIQINVQHFKKEVDNPKCLKESRAFIPKIKTSIRNIIGDFKYLKSCHRTEVFDLFFMMQGGDGVQNQMNAHKKMNFNLTNRRNFLISQSKD